MSYTVIIAKKNGHMVFGWASDVRSPAKAVEKIRKENKIRRALITDVIVTLGFSGSKVFHLSQNINRETNTPTQKQMDRAFKSVRNKDDWKNPINTTIKDPGFDKLRVIEQAITHFTGSLAEVTDLGNGKVRIEADGYYARIGN